MENLKILYQLILDIWNHMKSTINTKSESEWESCINDEYEIVGKIKDARLRQLAIEWLASWERYVEDVNKC